MVDKTLEIPPENIIVICPCKSHSYLVDLSNQKGEQEFYCPIRKKFYYLNKNFKLKKNKEFSRINKGK